MKALFHWKMGPLPKFADGEVEVKPDGIMVKLPKELAKKLKLGTAETLGEKAKEGIKDALKGGALFAVFGPAGAAMAMSLGKGKPVTIPYEYISGIEVVKVRYGVFGKKDSIKMSISRGGSKVEFIFAPYKGTISRKWLTQDFYNEVMRRMKPSRRAKAVETVETVEKPVKKPKKTKKAKAVKKATKRVKRVKRVEEAPEVVTKALEEPKPTFRFCPNCGSELKPGYKFCPYCGYKLF